MTGLAAHRGRRQPLLARFRHCGILHRMAERDGDSTATFDSRSPVDDTPIAIPARGTLADADCAALAAWLATSSTGHKRIRHRIADDTACVLSGVLWTGEPTLAMQFPEAPEAGRVRVSSEHLRHLPTPSGRVKARGIGRKGGRRSFGSSTGLRTVALATGRHRIARCGA